jgi:hypothetical protein
LVKKLEVIYSHKNFDASDEKMQSTITLIVDHSEDVEAFHAINAFESLLNRDDFSKTFFDGFYDFLIYTFEERKRDEGSSYLLHSFVAQLNNKNANEEIFEKRNIATFEKLINETLSKNNAEDADLIMSSLSMILFNHNFNPSDEEDFADISFISEHYESTEARDGFILYNYLLNNPDYKESDKRNLIFQRVMGLNEKLRDLRNDSPYLDIITGVGSTISYENFSLEDERPFNLIENGINNLDTGGMKYFLWCFKRIIGDQYFSDRNIEWFEKASGVIMSEQDKDVISPSFASLYCFLDKWNRPIEKYDPNELSKEIVSRIRQYKTENGNNISLRALNDLCEFYRNK